MKTIKQISRIFLATLVLTFSLNASSAQERKESLDKTYKLNSNGDFYFSCYDTDLKVNTWKKDEVRLTGEITIKGGDKEDQDKLIEMFRNPEVKKSANSLSIETNMAKSTIQIGFFTKTTLVNGEKVTVDKFKVTYTIWVPESIAFRLKSKYNNIDIANLTGKVNFELYDVDLTMMGFGEEGIFKMKYSTASIAKGGNSQMDIYDSDLEIFEMNDVKLTSKYSDYTFTTLNNLEFHSYDDDIRIENINSLKTEAKYSDYKIGSNMTKANIAFYDSDISAQNIGEIKFTGKYSSLKAQNSETVNVPELYDSEIKLADVGSFTCPVSKYDDVSFASISKSIELGDIYTPNFNFGIAKAGFENFTGKFKYGSVKLAIGPSIEYSLKFDKKYGTVKFPKERFKISGYQPKENVSEYSFEASTSENAKCSVSFSAYDTDLNFTNEISASSEKKSNAYFASKSENSRPERPSRNARSTR